MNDSRESNGRNPASRPHGARSQWSQFKRFGFVFSPEIGLWLIEAALRGESIPATRHRGFLRIEFEFGGQFDLHSPDLGVHAPHVHAAATEFFSLMKGEAEVAILGPCGTSFTRLVASLDATIIVPPNRLHRVVWKSKHGLARANHAWFPRHRDEPSAMQGVHQEHDLPLHVVRYLDEAA
jgi:hypothetical protein